MSGRICPKCKIQYSTIGACPNCGYEVSNQFKIKIRDFEIIDFRSGAPMARVIK